MSNIIQFPKPSKIQALEVRDRPWHKISICVSDEINPKETRWQMQFAIQNAAGFQSLKGFNNKAAIGKKHHKFTINSEFYLERFIREIEFLICQSRVIVKIDGALVLYKTKLTKYVSRL